MKSDAKTEQINAHYPAKNTILLSKQDLAMATFILVCKQRKILICQTCAKSNTFFSSFLTLSLQISSGRWYIVLIITLLCLAWLRISSWKCLAAVVMMHLGGGPLLNSFTGCFRWGAGWPSSLGHTCTVDKWTHWHIGEELVCVSDSCCVQLLFKPKIKVTHLSAMCVQQIPYLNSELLCHCSIFTDLLGLNKTYFSYNEANNCFVFRYSTRTIFW